MAGLERREHAHESRPDHDPAAQSLSAEAEPSRQGSVSLRGGDTVVITRASTEHNDPMVAAFLAQLEALIGEVERARRRAPVADVHSNDPKRLAAITKLASGVIPREATRAALRQGETLGGQYTHWFCAG